MKTEWEYQFEAVDFHFEKTHKYEGTLGGPVDFGYGEVSDLEFVVRLVPNDERECPDGVAQCGSLFVKIGIGYDKARPVADFIAQQMVERISFESGLFRLRGGLIFCERIPETPEEEQEVGDAPHAAHLQLEEVGEAPTFDSTKFQESSSSAMDLRLIAQFNEAKNQSTSIPKFSGLFRIIESLYSAVDRTYLKDALLSSEGLKRNFRATVTGSFEEFVADAVDIRNKCAHLKLKKDYGYNPLSLEVKERIEPILEPLEYLCQECIRNP